MQVARGSGLIIATLLLSALSTVAGFMVSPGGYLSPLASPALLGATGGITGTIVIGPVFPICSVIVSSAPAPSYYNEIQLLVTPSSGLALTVPVHWLFVQDCWVSGTFRIGLNPGAYSLTLTSCISQPNSFGCSDLPMTAIVASGAWTRVEISVRTGIE